MAGVKISALPVSAGLDGTELVPVVDGGVTQRTTVADIAALAGGGVPTDLLQLADNQTIVTYPDSTPTTITWDPTIAGGAYYRTNGTAITWNISDPTRLTIAANGFYDFDASVVVAPGVTTDVYGFILFSINGTPSAYGLASHTFVPVSFSGAIAVQGRLKRIALSAADYVEVVALFVNAGDTSNQVAQVVATRVG